MGRAVAERIEGFQATFREGEVQLRFKTLRVFL
jgi:hypothetical protein